MPAGQVLYVTYIFSKALVSGMVVLVDLHLLDYRFLWWAVSPEVELDDDFVKSSTLLG